jgi:AcrR family transcriptional regulator
MPHVRPQQRAARREQIVRGAFETWGRSVFYHTRLDDVASSLHITKPALYRYFRGKKDLVDAMERLFVAEHAALGTGFAAAAPQLAPADAVDLFVSERVRFFGTHIPYYYFVIHHMGTHRDSAMLRDLAAQLAGLASTLERVAGIHDPRAAASYIRSTISFFLMRSGLRNDTLRPHRLSEAQLEDLVSLVSAVCARGYGISGADLSPARMREMEKTCAAAPDDVPAEDPILRAVAQTVAEHGFAEASVERIARRAGLTKSTLYFHFRDRGDMFSRLIGRHQERLRELFVAKSAPFASPCERLYCFLVVLASYLRSAREIPAVLTWFRYHGYQIRGSHPDEATLERWLGFLGEAVRAGILASRGIPVAHMGGHLSFVVINHMMMGARAGDEPRLADLRQIYDLFIHGYSGPSKTTSRVQEAMGGLGLGADAKTGPSKPMGLGLGADAKS